MARDSICLSSWFWHYRKAFAMVSAMKIMLGLWLPPKWWIFSAKGRKTFTGQQCKQNLESGHCRLLPIHVQTSLSWFLLLLCNYSCKAGGVQHFPASSYTLLGCKVVLALQALRNYGGMAVLNKVLGWFENWQRRRRHCNSDCHFTHSSIWYPKGHLLDTFIQLKGLALLVVDVYLDRHCLPEAQYHDAVANSFDVDCSDSWETQLSHPWPPLALSPASESPATPRFPRPHPQAKHVPWAGPHPGTSSCTLTVTHSLGRMLRGTSSAGGNT